MQSCRQNNGVFHIVCVFFPFAGVKWWCGKRHLLACLLLRHLEALRSTAGTLQLAAPSPWRALLPTAARAGGVHLPALSGAPPSTALPFPSFPFLTWPTGMAAFQSRATVAECDLLICCCLSLLAFLKTDLFYVGVGFLSCLTAQIFPGVSRGNY